MSETVIKEFFVNGEDLSVVVTIPEGAAGKFAVVDSVESLMEQFDKDKLKTIITSVRGKALNGDDSKSQKKLAFEIFKMVTEPKKKPAVKKKKPAKVTKVSMAKEILKAKKTISKQDLADAVGHDLANCHTMVSILRNPARTKDPMHIAYNKVTAMYTYCETQEAMIEMEKGFAKEAAEATEAAEAKKAKEKADKKAAADKKKADEKAAADKKKADSKDKKDGGPAA